MMARSNVAPSMIIETRLQPVDLLLAKSATDSALIPGNGVRLNVSDVVVEDDGATVATHATPSGAINRSAASRESRAARYSAIIKVAKFSFMARTASALKSFR